MLLAAFLAASSAGSDPARIEPGALSRAMDEAMDNPAGHACAPAGEDEILVCAEPRRKYRVDPVVLAIERESEKGPAKPPLDASTTTAGGDCIGPQKCGDAVLPLVKVALAALKAATLAAKGEDWKDAFRPRPPEYQRYLEEQARAKTRAKVQVTLGANR